MAGSKSGGLITRDKLLRRDPDYYVKMGALGGKRSRGGGFAALDKEQLFLVSQKGGRVSRR